MAMAARSFKDQLALDVQSTFINPDEFATEHNIDGRNMWVVVDTDQLGSNIPGLRGSQPPAYNEGVFVNQKVIYVDSIEFGYTPEEDQRIKFDGSTYIVRGVKDDDGILMIMLEANRS
jgi:hypothetical protein